MRKSNLAVKFYRYNKLVLAAIVLERFNWNFYLQRKCTCNILYINLVLDYIFVHLTIISYIMFILYTYAFKAIITVVNCVVYGRTSLAVARNLYVFLLDILLDKIIK